MAEDLTPPDDDVRAEIVPEGPVATAPDADVTPPYQARFQLLFGPYQAPRFRAGYAVE